MIQYRISCSKCAKSLRHGSTAPANVDGCTTARIMRMSCKELGCRFEVVGKDVEFNDTDLLRLDLREDRRIA